MSLSNGLCQPDQFECNDIYTKNEIYGIIILNVCFNLFIIIIFLNNFIWKTEFKKDEVNNQMRIERKNYFCCKIRCYLLL